MRILFLVSAVMLVSVSAEAQLCDPAWLASASGGEARALIRAGADVNQICNTNRNRPLHQALLGARVDADVVRALIEGGGDLSLQNIHGETAAGYAEERFERARAALRPGTAAYRREQALFETVFNDAFGREADARDQAESLLCDLEWWGSSANGSSVRALLAQGADPETRCNQNNDRPLHIALRWENFMSLPAGVKDAVLALAASGVSLGSRNNQGRTALALAEIRYDRYLARAQRTRPAWCEGSAADPDIELYLGVKYLATGESRESLAAATRRDVCGGAGGDVPRQAGSVFRECDACPEMVVMPGGRLALGRYEVTVDEYAAFASAAGGAGGGCRVHGSSGWSSEASASWRNPGFSQSGRDPVVCVSWNDAQEYVSWLSRTTGATYRLPSESEWGSAASGSGGGCSVNGGDAELMPYLRQSTGANWQWADGRGPSCPGSDGALFTAPVGSYGSNGVGLSDMVGNVWEWTEGCWEGDCGRRVVRGGSWILDAEHLGAGARVWHRAGGRNYVSGFRVARTLD